MGYRDVLLSDRPILTWPFTESTGTTAASLDAGGLLQRTLNHNNSPALAQPGIGDGTPENCVAYLASATTYSLTASSITGMTPNTPPYTLECWVKWTTASTVITFCTLRDSTASQANVLMLFLASLSTAGTISLFYTTGGSTSASITTTTTYNDGFWHHVAGTVTAAGVVTLYVDGIAQVTASNQSASGSTAPNLMVGANNNAGSPSQNFTGSVAWPAIYEYALSPARVLAHYRAGRGVGFGQGAAPGSQPRRRRGR
jgi:hypothetical protein